MIKELNEALSLVPSLIKDKENWGSLLINKYPPVIHRLSYKISDKRTLLLHKLFNTNGDHSLMHSHSWPFACKVLEGGYEMGVGWSENRDIIPEVSFTSFIKSGDVYEMLSPNLFHFTKPQENIKISYSVMLIGERIRERKAENNSPLSDQQKQEMFEWFGDWFSSKL